MLRCRLYLEPLEDRRLLTAGIEGTVWHDANADGQRNADEASLEGWTVYLDANDNGRLDAGETRTTSDASGNYLLADVTAGEHIVRTVTPTGWEQTAPDLFDAPVAYSTGTYPASILSVDLDGDGDLDLAAANQGTASVSLYRNVGAGSFISLGQTSVGALPFFVTHGDLDADSDQDLIVGNRESNSVSVLLNDGDGAFAPAVNYGVGIHPVHAAVVDVDGDLDGDLVVSNRNGGNLTVLENAGNGTYSQLATVAVNGSPMEVISRDLDADGNLDLLVGFADTSHVRMLLGAGDGTFPESVDLPVQATPENLVLSDLDSDGIDDLIVSNMHAGSVSVLRGLPGGNFATAQHYAAGTLPRNVQAADFDGDGDVDIVVASHLGSTLSLLLNNGDGTLAAYQTLTSTPSIHGVEAGDFDGDGRPDLAVSDLNHHQIRVMRNNAGAWTVAVAADASTASMDFGNQRFVPPIDLSFANSYETGTHPLSAATADFNSDGVLDIAVANYTSGSVSVFLGNSDGTFADSSTTLPAPGHVAEVITTDLNRDGVSDILATTEDGFCVSIWLGVGHGTFTARTDYGTGSWVNDIAIGHFTSDADLDIVVASWSGSVTLFKGDGAGNLENVKQWNYSGNFNSLEAADFNGDGLDDLVIANTGENFLVSLRRIGNDTNGIATFASPVSFSTGNYPLRFTVADFDRDGILDVLTAEALDTRVSYFKGCGDGTFAVAEPYHFESGAYDLQTADFNDDGILDVSVELPASNKVRFLLGRGDGTFMISSFSLTTAAEGYSATVGDFDGNGTPDLASLARADNQLQIWLNQAEPANPHLSLDVPASTSLSTPFTITVSALDSAGNIKTDFTGTVHFASSDSFAELPIDYTFDGSEHGVKSFEVMLGTGGQQTISATLLGSDPMVVCADTVFVNRSPALSGVPANVTILEEQAYTFDADATDIDLPAQTLTFGLVDAPAGASIDPVTGVFGWTPSEAQGSETYSFLVAVSDGMATVEAPITITVNELNRAPVLEVVGDKTVDEGTLLTFTVTASDPDLPANTLTLSAGDLPAGAAFDPATGVFTWTPSEAQGPGSCEVTFTVSDGSLTDEETITITINEVNQPPVLSPIGDKSIDEGAALSFVVTAADPFDDPPNHLVLSATGLPSGATFDAATGQFSWTPSESQDGTYEVTFGVREKDPSFAVLADSPLAYWRLAEPDGNVAVDSSGNGRDATYAGPTLNQPGVFDGDTAVLFEASESDYIQYGTDLCPGTGSWSVEAWVKMDSPTGQPQNIVTYYPGGYTANHNSYWALAVSPTGIPTFDMRDVAGRSAPVIGDASVIDNQWHHIVGVLDRSSATAQLYVDGVQVGSGDASTLDSVFDAGYPINIGWMYTYWSGILYRFDGQLDSVGVYDQALSPARILAHYESYADAAMADSETITITVNEVRNAPAAVLVSSDAVTEGERLVEHVSELVVVFPDAMMTSGAGSVTDPANWQLVGDGTDITDPISSISWGYNAAIDAHEATLTLSGPLTAADYLLTAKETILDAHGVSMAGGDFTRSFRIVDPMPLGPETLVNTYTGLDQTNPRGVFTSTGELLVTWSSGQWWYGGQDGWEFGIYLQRYDAEGQPIGGEVQINQATVYSQIGSFIGVDAEDNYVLAWQHSVGSDWRIFGRRYAADGTPLDNEFQVNGIYNGNQVAAYIAVSPTGSFMIVWWDELGSNDGSGQGVFGRIFDASGVPITSDFSLTTQAWDNQNWPAVVAGADGSFIATWTSYNHDGSGAGVYAQRFGANGNRLGDEFLVNTTTAGGQVYPTIGADEDGDFVIAWYSDASTDHPEGIYAQRYDRDGTPQSGEIAVSQTPPQWECRPRVGLDQDGDFVVSWSANGLDGDAGTVVARRFNRLGQPLSDEIVVNTTIAGNQGPFDVVMKPDGDFVILWEGNGPGDGYGVFMTRFGELPPQAPTSAGIADVTVDEDAPDTVIDLFAVFDDYEDADTDLVFTIEANTNAALFSAITIEPVAGTLTLDYAPDAVGVSELTVRATDTDGMFVDEMFTITVQGVLSYWKLDDGSGTVAVDSLGLQHGVLVNGPTWTSGQVDGALSFDGVDDYVDLGKPIPAELRPSDAITIEAWVNPRAYSNAAGDIVGGIVAAQYDADGTAYSISIDYRDSAHGGVRGGLHFQVGGGPGIPYWATAYEGTTSTALPLNTWTHVVAVADPGQQYRVYFDGELVADWTPRPEPIAYGTSNRLALGWNESHAGSARFLQGSIDEVAIHSRAFSQEDALDHFNLGRQGLGYYDTDDVTPEIVATSLDSHTTGVYIHTPIEYTFSEAMDRDAVENAFSISPNVSGEFTWDDTTLIFTPDVPLATTTTYSVSISTDATDLVGNPLAGPHAASFSTDFIERPEGIISHWRLDEEAGGTIAYDAVRSNDAVLVGDPTSTIGRRDGSLAFDGVDDYVEIGKPIPASLQPSGAITIEVWVNPSAHSNAAGDLLGGIVASQYDGDSTGYSLSIDYRDSAHGGVKGGVHFQVGAGYGRGYWTTAYEGTTSTALPLNTWTHVVAVAEPGRQYRVYFDGVLVADWTPRAESIGYGPNNRLAIGWNESHAGSARFFRGSVDEVVIYGRALSQEEVTQLYATVTAADTAPQVVASIDDVEVEEDAGDTTVDLHAVFDDQEDADVHLVLAVTGNTNASLFRSVTIDPSTGRLTLDYAPDQNGTAALTVRATDTGGLYCDDVFTVVVNPLRDGPRAILVSDDPVTEGERLVEHVSQLVIEFPDAMMSSGVGSVTDLANWQLTAGGADITSEITSITWGHNAETGVNEATLSLANPLTANDYQLTAKGTILDANDQPMLGGDFTRSFRIVDLVPIGPETRVNTYTYQDQYHPRGVFSPNGDLLVTWSSGEWWTGGQDGHEYGVFFQRYDANGQPIGGEIQINQATVYSQIQQSIGMDADGDYVIAWQHSTGTDWRIYARQYQADGTPLSNEFQVNANAGGNQVAAEVAVAPNGHFMVAWWDHAGHDGSGQGAFARIFDASGTAMTGDICLTTEVWDNQEYPVVAAGADGGFIATWTSYNHDGSGGGIYAQRFDAVGNRLGGEFLVNTTTAGGQRYPTIAADEDGDFVIAWYSEAAPDHPEGIYAQRYDQMGTPIGGESQVSETPPQAVSFPFVAVDADGDFVVSWMSNVHHTDAPVSVYRRFNRLGEPQGVERMVNTTTAGAQGVTDIAMKPDGDFVILWNGNGVGDDRGSFAQRYGEAENQAPVVVAPVGAIHVNEDADDEVIDLFGVFDDYEDADTDLVFTIESNTHAALFSATTIDPVAGTLTLNYAPTGAGLSAITVRATDSDGIFVDELFTVTVRGQLAHWEFNDGNGTTAADTAGSNNGTLVNGPAWTTGTIDGALAFDGVDDYVDIGKPVPASLQPKNAVTLEAWVNPIAYSNAAGDIVGVIVSSQYDASQTGYSLAIDYRESAHGGVRGGVCFLVGDDSFWVTATEGTTTTPLPLDEWTHVVAVAESGSQYRVYFNGVLVANWTPKDGDISYDLQSRLSIGWNEHAPGSQRFFNGSIDDVAIYNYALSATEVLTHYETHANNAPIVALPIEDIVVDEDAPDAVIDLTEVFIDPGGDPLTFSAVSSDESLLTATVAGTQLTLHYLENQHGTASITVTASDPAGATTFDEFAVTVTSVNDAPVLDLIGGRTVNEEEQLAFTISAHDVDLPANGLSFSVDGLPEGATFDTETGEFAWIPLESQQGIYELTFTVTDHGSPSLSDSETITITVAEVNDAPVLGLVGDKEVYEGSSLTFIITASDHNDDPVNTLAFSALDLPSGASFNPVTGEFVWAPTVAQIGTHQLTFLVTDDGSPNLTDAETVTISVLSSGGPVETLLDRSEWHDYDGTGTSGVAHIAVTLGEAVQSAVEAAFAAYEQHLIDGLGGDVFEITPLKIRLINFTQFDRLLRHGSFAGIYDHPVAGTYYSETVTGTPQRDLLVGFGGNDTFVGGGGDDIFVGGSGNDTFHGEDGDDVVLYSGSSNGYDHFNGGEGIDRVVAVSSQAVIGIDAYANGVERFEGQGDTIIRDTYYGRTLDFSQTELVNIAEIDAGAGNDTIVASDLSAGQYRGGTGNDVLRAGAQDVVWLYTGTSNGYDSFQSNGPSQVVARVETAGTVIGVDGYQNGVDVFEGIAVDGHPDTIIRDTYYSRTLDFSQTELVNVAEVDAGAGNDTVVASDLSAGQYRGGTGNDVLRAGSQDVVWLYTGTSNGYDNFQNNGLSQVVARVETAGTVIGVDGYQNGVDVFEGIALDGSLDTIIRDTYYSRTLDFSQTELVNVAEVDAGAGNDTIVASDLSAGQYRGGTGNDVLRAGAHDVVWLYSGADNGYDNFQNNGPSQVVARVETAGTVIGVDGYQNGVDVFEGIAVDGHPDTIIRDTYYSRTLDFSQTELVNIAEVDAATGNDTIVASELSGGRYRGGSGSDMLYASQTRDTIWLYRGGDNGYDRFLNNGPASVTAIAETLETAIGVDGYENGVDLFQGTGDTLIIDIYYSNLLDFSLTILEGIAQVDTGGGNDTIIAPLEGSGAICWGGAGNDTLNANGSDIVWQFVGTNNGYDWFVGNEDDNVVNAVTDADGTIIGVNGYENGVDEFQGTGDTVIRDIYYSRLLDFSDTRLVGIGLVDAGDGNDTVIASNLSSGRYMGGAGNDLLTAGAVADTTWVYSGTQNGYDTLERVIPAGVTPTNTVVMQAESAGTVIGVNGFNNGADIVRGHGSGDTIIRDTFYSRTLDFSKTQLVDIAEIDAADGNDTIVTSNVSSGRYRGGSGADHFVISDKSSSAEVVDIAILDFTDGVDRIDLSAFGLDADSLLETLAIHQEESDVVIQLPGQEKTIRLVNFNVDDLDSDDFLL